MAYAAPAASGRTRVSGSSPAPVLGSDKSATPPTPTRVATAQRGVGRSRNASHEVSPAKTGALPIATSVPTATPARATPSKNASWYAATALAAAMVGRNGHDVPARLRRESAT